MLAASQSLLAATLRFAHNADMSVAPRIRPELSSFSPSHPDPGLWHRAEPVWRVASRLHCREVPESALRWLLDPASLTRRVQAACDGCFRVQVLGQGYARPQRNEAQRLSMREGSSAFVREVHLLCDELPWVFARTVIPRTTLTGPRRHLTRLKSRPLGAVLFADPSMERGPVEIARLAPGDRLYPIRSRERRIDAPIVWGRRSVFTLAGHPLLVSEIFLPDIPEHP